MPKDLSRVQNIVITMLENRSFDHILGYLGLPDSGHPFAAPIEGRSPSPGCIFLSY
jgi:phospholipase C